MVMMKVLVWVRTIVVDRDAAAVDDCLIGVEMVEIDNAVLVVEVEDERYIVT
jgi:hypothetical protein